MNVITAFLFLIDKIKENVNPRKWICVGVEKEDVIVKNKGNLIILIMVKDETTRNKIEQGFDKLYKNLTPEQKKAYGFKKSGGQINYLNLFK